MTPSRRGHHHAYLLPEVARVLDGISPPGSDRRIFDLGCGDGSVARWLTDRGFQVVGVDPWEEGIWRGNAGEPGPELHVGSSDDPLQEIYGQFPTVLSLEVIEHVPNPRHFMGVIFQLLEPGGSVIVSTPFHGYWKNLALAASGKLDQHFTALWDGGHIKFWSRRTITILFEEIGFEDIHISLAGRVPVVANSMVVTARRPGGTNELR